MPYFFTKTLKIPLITLLYLLFLLAADRSYASLLTLAAALLHEAGHLLAARVFGAHIRRITLYPFGADIRLEGGRLSYAADAAIAASGIAVNAVCGTLFLLTANGAAVPGYFAACHFLLALVNCMPVDGLDGAGILRAFAASLWGEERAERILRIVSLPALILLWIPACYLLFYSGGNASLLAVCAGLFAMNFFPKETEDFRG